MAKTAFSKSFAPVIFLCVFSFFCVYVYFCLIVSSDVSFREDQIAVIPLLDHFATRLQSPIHSGAYDSMKAGRLQYMEHDPAELDSIYRASVAKSPADSAVLLSYAEFLNSKNCCKEQIEQLLKASLRVNPRSFKLLFATISFLGESGKNDEAAQYFRSALTIDRKASMKLLRTMAEKNKDVNGLVELAPLDGEEMRPLLDALSRGSANRLAWFKLLEKLEEEDIAPTLVADIANQALRLQEYDIARKYALLAQNHPQTKDAASRVMKNLEKKERRKSPK